MDQPANPQLDVLIPTYNPKPEHLREALDALLAQTFTNWNALIHDDASEAEVENIVKPYLKDHRLKFERSEKRLGIGGNWNACFQKTSAPFIAYLFQDDVWNPAYLENAIRILCEHHDVGFVSMDHAYKIEGESVGNEGYAILQKIREEQFTHGRHDGKIFLSHWIQSGLWPNIIGEPDFVVMRRSIMKKVGPFNEAMPQVLDIDYWVRLLRATNLFHHKEHSGSFRVHPNAASVRNLEKGHGLFDRFKTLDILIKTMPRGIERKAAQKAQIKQFELMAEKYRKKKQQGDTIKYNGIGCLKKFCLRHPVVVMKTGLKTLTRNKEIKLKN